MISSLCLSPKFFYPSEEFTRIAGVKYFSSESDAIKGSASVFSCRPYRGVDNNILYLSIKSLKKQFSLDLSFVDMINQSVNQGILLNTLFRQKIREILNPILGVKKSRCFIDRVTRQYGDLNLLRILTYPEVNVNCLVSTLKKIEKSMKKYFTKEAIKEIQYQSVIPEVFHKGAKEITKKHRPCYGFTIVYNGDVYIRIKKIAQGCYKEIFDTFAMRTGEAFATYLTSEINLLDIELNALKLLNQKKISHIQSECLIAYHVDSSLAVALANKIHGDASNIRGASASVINAVLIRVIETLQSMHNAGFTHHDIKPENMFLVRDSKDRIKDVLLGDMAFVKSMGIEYPENAVGGTTLYCPPEHSLWRLFQSSKLISISTNQDAYGIGISMVELIIMLIPDWGDNVLQVFEKFEELELFVMNEFESFIEDFTEEEFNYKKDILQVALKLIHPDVLQRIPLKVALEELKLIKKKHENRMIVEA